LPPDDIGYVSPMPHEIVTYQIKEGDLLTDEGLPADSSPSIAERFLRHATKIVAGVENNLKRARHAGMPQY